MSRLPTISPAPRVPVPGPTFDASTLDEEQRDRFHRNLRAVEQVLAGASQTRVAKESGIDRSTLSRLVKRTRELAQIACVPHGGYHRAPQLHPAFQECIRRLYVLPTRLTTTAIQEHAEMHQVATRLSTQTGPTVTLPSYKQVRTEINRLKMEPEDGIAVAERVHAAVLVCVKTAAILGAVLSRSRNHDASSLSP